MESAFGLRGGVSAKGSGQGTGERGQRSEVSQRRRTGVSALHDLQNYFAVVFAGLEEFVGFFGFGQGEDVADLGS